MDVGCAFLAVIVLTLFAGDVFNALLMTTSSKLCVEEFVEALAAYVFAEWLRFGVHFCFSAL